MLWSIVGDPARDQRAVPIGALRAAGSVQIVEIMEVIEPELGVAGGVPTRGAEQLGGTVQEAEIARPQHRRGAGGRIASIRHSPCEARVGCSGRASHGEGSG